MRLAQVKRKTALRNIIVITIVMHGYTAPCCNLRVFVKHFIWSSLESLRRNHTRLSQPPCRTTSVTMFALGTERFTAHFKVIVVSVPTRMSGVRLIRETVRHSVMACQNPKCDNDVEVNYDLFRFQGQAQAMQNKIYHCGPDGVRLASHRLCL